MINALEHYYKLAHSTWMLSTWLIGKCSAITFKNHFWKYLMIAYINSYVGIWNLAKIQALKCKLDFMSQVGSKKVFVH